MTTIQDRIIENIQKTVFGYITDFSEKPVNYFGIDFTNLNKVVSNSIKEVEEETRKETFKNVLDKMDFNLETGNFELSEDDYDLFTNKEKQKSVKFVKDNFGDVIKAVGDE